MLLKERIREYVQSKLQYALTSRTIDIPPKGAPSVFGNGMVMHYVSHVPEATTPLAFHSNHNRADNPPRTPMQLSLAGGAAPTSKQLQAALDGNRRVNQILGHNDSGKAVPFFSDRSSAERLASMTGGVARSVVMDPEKIGNHMRSAGDHRNSKETGGYIGVYSHPQLGDYFRTASHRHFIDHAQTASLNTTGAGEIHEHIQNEPDNHLHRLALADHLEEQGKSGLADKVRQTVPLHFRRKYAIIRFCRQRLRYAQSSKYGLPLESGEPVEKLNTDGSRKTAGFYQGEGPPLPSGQPSAIVKGFQLRSYPNWQSEFDPALLGHISRGDLVRHTLNDLRDRHAADPTPAPAAEATQQAAPPATPPPPAPAKKPARVRLATSPLNASILPAADVNHHIHKDHYQQRDGADGKLNKIFDGQHSEAARNLFFDWLGKPVSDEHIADMLGVPRPSHLPNYNHPVLYDNLRGTARRWRTPPVAGKDPIHSMMTVESRDPDYEYEHDNRLKYDSAGQPYLYFNIVRHGGDRNGGDKAISMPHVLWNAATAAHANGVKKIKLHAALGGDWVGGVYWPKMGFDHNLMEAFSGQPRTWNAIVRAMQKSPHLYGGIEGKKPTEYTLLDMLHHPTAYRKYFEKNPSPKEYGTEHQFPNARNLLNAYFDTDPNSRSMKILAAYLRKIEGGASGQVGQPGVKQ